MSHLVEIETRFTNRDAILEAAGQLGWKVEQHEQAAALVNWYGQQDRRANLIVRRAQAQVQADFGWLRDGTTGEYTAIVDKMALGNRWDSFMNEYGFAVAAQAARDEGMYVQRSQNDRGEPVLLAQRWA